MTDFRLDREEMMTLADTLSALADMCEGFQDGSLSSLVTTPYEEDPTLFVVAEDFEERWHKTRDVLASNCRALAKSIDSMTGTVRKLDLNLGITK